MLCDQRSFGRCNARQAGPLLARLCLLRDQTWPFKPVCHNASARVDNVFKVLRVAAFNR
jgi:hypothetical protein